MRSLRLKEIAPGTDDWLSAADLHRSISDDTLPAGPFRRRGTPDGFLHTGNERPHAARNLVLLGGSFVESMFCAEELRFPSGVERSLPPEWRVLNAGYSGMTSLHALTQLGAKIAPYATGDGMLVFFVSMSDSSALAARGLYWSATKTVTPFVPAADVGSPSWHRQQAATRMISAFLAAAQALGIRLPVVASPYRDGDFDTDQALRALYREDRRRYAHARGRFSLLRAVAREECERRGIPFLDAQEVVGDPALFYDQMHLNEAGQRQFTRELTAWLLPLLSDGGVSPS